MLVPTLDLRERRAITRKICSTKLSSFLCVEEVTMVEPNSSTRMDVGSHAKPTPATPSKQKQKVARSGVTLEGNLVSINLF